MAPKTRIGTRLARRFFVIALGGSLVACGLIAGIDDYHIGDCKGGQCAEGGAIDDVFTPQDDSSVPTVDTGVPCTGVQNPTSIRVGSDTNTFCIDQTEITNGAYNAFLEAGVSLTAQTGVCQWNTTYVPTPEVAPPADAAVVVPPENYPVVNIDWCDAFAYCQWAGKYLCGQVINGHKVGPVTDEGLSDYKSHQWMLACSAEARLRYPYGGIFDPAKCNLVDLDAGHLVEAGSTACIGGYEGLHDMVGNAWEWFDGPCVDDAGLPDGGTQFGHEADQCIIKGGSFLDEGASYDCRLDLQGIRRDFRGVNVGFRCCSD